MGALFVIEPLVSGFWRLCGMDRCEWRAERSDENGKATVVAGLYVCAEVQIFDGDLHSSYSLVGGGCRDHGMPIIDGSLGFGSRPVAIPAPINRAVVWPCVPAINAIVSRALVGSATDQVASIFLVLGHHQSP